MQQARGEEEAQHHRPVHGLCCVTSLIHGQLLSGCQALDCQPLGLTSTSAGAPLVHALRSSGACPLVHCTGPALQLMGSLVTTVSDQQSGER